MSYSVYFFGLDAKEIAAQFVAAPRPIISRVEELIRGKRHFSEEDVQSTVSKAAAICENRLPESCDVEYFHALCWLAEAVGEKISISSLLGFRHIQFLEDTGIWLWLMRSRPSFSVPVCNHHPPQVGFINAEDMERFAIPGISRLAPADRVETNYGRQEFQEVLESLASDKLDLLAVLLG